MIDLKKLLVCDGRPSKEMIDYIVDLNMKRMIDDFVSTISEANNVSQGYLDIDKRNELHRHFSIASYPQHYSEITNDLKESVKRYDFFVKVREWNDDDDDFNKKLKKTTIISMKFLLSISITPEMKKMILLDNELETKPSTSNCRSKI